MQEIVRRMAIMGLIMATASPQQSESVRRALGGALEFRRFAGLDRPFAAHAHDYPVIGLVREGCRLMECNRRTYRLEAGQLLALNAGDAHGCIQMGPAPLVYDSVALLGFPDCPPFEGPLVEHAEARACMEDIAALMDAAPLDEGAVEEALYLLIDHLSAPADIKPRDEAARAMAAYLRTHVDQTVRLDALAEAAGLDKYRALRIFTAAFGLTPMRYLASLRVERARELLARGAGCADAALQAGFSDQAHLTRAFKERLGVTPGFYQRAVAGKSAPIARRQKAHL